MKLPLKISPEPIIECVFEIRYKSEIPSQAIFGIIYSAVKDFFKPPVPLPILQLPDLIRSKDPALKYAPHYELIKDENIKFRIGPNVLSFINNKTYLGWSDFFNFIQKILLVIQPNEIFKNIERLGLRYVNYFEENILDKINLNISMGDKMLLGENIALKIEMKEDDFSKVLQIANNAVLMLSNKSIKGSIIDVDCGYNIDISNEDFFKKYDKISNEVHLKEKTLFFNLLKPDFLKTLNPVYEDKK